MKTPQALFLLLILTLFTLTNCDDDDQFLCISGNGSIVTRTLDVSSFSGIDCKGAMDVVLMQGETQEVIAEGHLNIIEDLRTQVFDDVWDIELVQDCYRDYELKITITLPDINAIALTGSGDVRVNDFEDQGNLDLEITGSGNIDLNEFNGTENLFVEITGSGDVTGNDDFLNLQKLEIDITGSGDFNGFPIITDDCTVNILGSGNAEVNVQDNLFGSITGSGDILYKGNPDIIVNITGSGNVINRN